MKTIFLKFDGHTDKINSFYCHITIYYFFRHLKAAYGTLLIWDPSTPDAGPQLSRGYLTMFQVHVSEKGEHLNTSGYDIL